MQVLTILKMTQTTAVALYIQRGCGIHVKMKNVIPTYNMTAVGLLQTSCKIIK